MVQVISTVECREHEEELLEISERARKILDADHNVEIPNPKVLQTITYVFLTNMIKMLAEKKEEGQGSQIRFGNLFEMGISYRENEDAEGKEGNYVPFINPIQGAELLVKK